MKSPSTPRLQKTPVLSLNKAPLCQAPDRVLRRPDLLLPLGATDCHAHICGPESTFSYFSERIYTPPDALLPDYFNLLTHLGVERAVLVQPSIYGTDNRAMLAALKAFPTKLRGVAVVDNTITNAEIEALHQAGVRGLRCNIVDLADATGQLPMTMLRGLAERIAPFGWHLEFLMHVDAFSQLQKDFHDFPVEIVIGHFGYVKASLGIANAGFRNLCALMREGRAWVKFTGTYRISEQAAPPYSDVNVFAEALLKANPQQIVWGTDWPHVMVNGFMPNDADLLDLLSTWVPEPALRKQILSINPARLYQF
jgi:predicted TIM-barrel fold metal-dependent hydrolase